MKDAPWFVDFFAPAIEDHPHELHGKRSEQASKTNKEETRAEKGSDGLTSAADKHLLGGSWQEVQQEMMRNTNQPLAVPPPSKARHTGQESLEGLKSQKESHVVYN